jgi:hypothetical protein
LTPRPALAAVLALLAVSGAAAVAGAQRAAAQAYWRDLPALALVEVGDAVRQWAHLAAIAGVGAFLVAAVVERRRPRAGRPRLLRMAAVAMAAVLAAGAAP